MTGKKVTFGQKPVSKDTDKIINDWVLGNNNGAETQKEISPTLPPELKRTTIYMPEHLRHTLKQRSLDQGKTMTDLILEALHQYIRYKK